MGSKSKGSQESKPSPIQNSAGNMMMSYIAGPYASQFTGESPADITYGQPVATPQYFTTGGQPSYQMSSTSQPNKQGNTSTSPYISSGTQQSFSPSLMDYSQPSKEGVPSAGYMPGTILPNFTDMMDLAGSSYFDTLVGTDANGNPTVGGEGVNPVLNQALSQAFNPTVNSNIASGVFSQVGGSAGAPMSTELNEPRIISQEDTAWAVDRLKNAPSLFDQMSGGPLMEQIGDITARQLDAVGSRLDEERTAAIQKSTADLAAGGLLSSDQLLRSREDIVRASLDDYALQAVGFEKENTMFLAQMAMSDIQTGDRRAEAILQAGLTEQGIRADYAATIAKVNADRLMAVQVAQINTAAQMAMNSQNAAMNLLQLGYNDFAGGIDRQLGVMMKPLDMAMGLATGGTPISTGTQKSKTI